MSSCEDQDELLSLAQDRANTAQTMFMLLDSDADGMVAVEQAQRPPAPRPCPLPPGAPAALWPRPTLHRSAPAPLTPPSCPGACPRAAHRCPDRRERFGSQLGTLLTSLLLSQELNFDGDVDELVLQISRHRNLVPFAPTPGLHTRAPAPSELRRSLYL